MPVSLRGFSIFAILVFGLSGCRERDEIRSYKIPKLVETPQEVKDAIVEYRILGVIVPTEDGSSWFFKTQGPLTALSTSEATVSQFFQSIKFPNGVTQKPIWDIPADWKEDRANPNRVATLTFGDPKKPFTLTITQFQGSVIDNANRWRRMVGAEEMNESELPKAAVAFKTASGQDAWRVDVRGRKNPDEGMKGMGIPGSR